MGVSQPFGADFAVQHAAFFQAVDRDVEVAFAEDGQAADDGVAVVFVRKDGVFAVAGVGSRDSRR